MIRIAIAALIAVAAPIAAQAQSHSGHAQHGAHAGHQHADFASDRLHVRVEGQGPDVIFIPGLTSSPEIWQGAVDHLAGRYRVHRIHVNGFAGAEAGANATGPVAAPVAEEIARLDAHLSEIDGLLAKGGDIGKRVDFLIQELHREANTLGSKSSSLELTRISVDMKVLIEQMREQVQNIE